MSIIIITTVKLVLNVKGKPGEAKEYKRLVKKGRKK